LASKRKIEDGTICPLLSVSDEQFESHIKDILNMPNTKILFGNKRIESHKGQNSIPKQYGRQVPTAVLVPFENLLKS
jgi:1-pyrroline-5-carboxylate dehydrogenase